MRTWGLFSNGTQPNETEKFQRLLAQGIREGVILPVLETGRIRLYHVKHTALIPADVKYLSLADVAQLNGWGWWFAIQ